MNTKNPRNVIKQFINQSFLLRTIRLVVSDFLWGLRLAIGQSESDSGSTHSMFSEKESVHYIEEVFTDYKLYGSVDNFDGIAAEVGPGDNCGVALLMRLDGCKQIDLVDRYLSYRKSEQQNKVYQALSQRHTIDIFKEKEVWDDRALVGIDWKIGQAAEVYFKQCAKNSGEIYDFIVSRAVLEHLYNPIDALKYMVDCLKSGGKMLHKVDLRDHGMFTPNHHELKFLEVPSSIYPLMVQNSGRPNRILAHRYRQFLEEMKSLGTIDYSFLVTHLGDVGEITPYCNFDDIELGKQKRAIAFVEKHRQNIASEFCDVSSQDIAISGIFLCIIKN
ncbi:methyltransferase domain-containing protein [Scytonema sp. UIC 10036]|uniref:methyltransferase domain-containing protein n=1 Tax=Scytonema sp. UIC 10036 TaxID=2304196 RepID=UPI0012DA2270|nr:methyltransferase domain-containing protein [Scytonema sp. UIC 10036]MUG98981.1 methyltransferase domain-containing protein [Scytonema sp. UIC 10036]